MTTRKSRSAPALPQPLTPAECSLSGYPAMLIDIPRLRQSDFDATPDDAAWRAGLNLWFSSWESVPAGSLRADDAALAKAAGLGRDLRTWGRVKTTAMQGFVLCTDGRIYHRTVCGIALGIWIDKLIRRHAGQRGNRGERPQQQREAELRAIEAQIVTAAGCLRALDPTAAALAKVVRLGPQCVPQCGDGGPALGPQKKGSEGNGSKSPSQNDGGLRIVSGAPGA